MGTFYTYSHYYLHYNLFTIKICLIIAIQNIEKTGI